MESTETWGQITKVEGQKDDEDFCQLLELNPEKPGLRMVFDLCNFSISGYLVFRLINTKEDIILFEQNVSLNEPTGKSLSGKEHQFYHLECPDLSNLSQGEYLVKILSQTHKHYDGILLQFKLMIHHNENQRGLINLPFKIEKQNEISS